MHCLCFAGAVPASSDRCTCHWLLAGARSGICHVQAGRKAVPNSPPYVEHPHSAARFEAGLPIPVTCCWNGIVSIDAAPLAKGVRFRYAPWLRSEALNFGNSLYFSTYPAVPSCTALQCTRVGRYWVLASKTASPRQRYGCQGRVHLTSAHCLSDMQCRTYGDGECRECEASNLCTGDLLG